MEELDSRPTCHKYKVPICNTGTRSEALLMANGQFELFVCDITTYDKLGIAMFHPISRPNRYRPKTTIFRHWNNAFIHNTDKHPRRYWYASSIALMHWNVMKGL